MSLPASFGSASRRSERPRHHQSARAARAAAVSHSGAARRGDARRVVAGDGRASSSVEQAAQRLADDGDRACRRRAPAAASSAASAERIPVVPGRASQVFGVSRRGRRAARRRRRSRAAARLFAEEPHLERRAGEAVDEQATPRSPLADEKAERLAKRTLATAYTVSAFPTCVTLTVHGIDAVKMIRGNSRLRRVSASPRWKTGRHASPRFGPSKTGHGPGAGVPRAHLSGRAPSWASASRSPAQGDRARPRRRLRHPGRSRLGVAPPRQGHARRRPAGRSRISARPTAPTSTTSRSRSTRCATAISSRSAPRSSSSSSAATSRPRYHEEIYRMTIIDGLTQALNKRYFLEILEKEIPRCARHQRPLSLVMFDIDHFKKINDEHGHLTGDYVLQGAGAPRADARAPRGGVRALRRRGVRADAARDERASRSMKVAEDLRHAGRRRAVRLRGRPHPGHHLARRRHDR